MMSDIKKSAEISPDGMYRYSLERTWDEGKPTVLFICLNPSTADAVEDDATVRRMVSFARQFGAWPTWHSSSIVSCRSGWCTSLAVINDD